LRLLSAVLKYSPMPDTGAMLVTTWVRKRSSGCRWVKSSQFSPTKRKYAPDPITSRSNRAIRMLRPSIRRAALPAGIDSPGAPPAGSGIWGDTVSYSAIKSLVSSQ